MVWGDMPNLRDNYSLLCSSIMEELEVNPDSVLEEEDIKHESHSEVSTIFVAFKGNIDDSDFKQKLGVILDNVPSLLHMESDKLKLKKVEPWNSVRVTFNIPREAAERLRLLAQNNNQQLRDLGILSVQIEGEGAINLSLAQNRGQDVQINGPVGQGNSVRMETGFPMPGSQGLIRINNPASVMMQQSASVSSSIVTNTTKTELQARTPHPPSQSDTMDPLLAGLTIQQQNHSTGSIVPQLHSAQPVPVNRQINPGNFQQMQPQQQIQPQQQLHPRPPQQQQQGIRPPFTTPAQVPVPPPPGWNQVPSGTVQPPSSQGTMGALTVNQGWKKTPLLGQMQQQLQTRPPLTTVQTPSHPPPPYPFGSQQASQAHTNFPQMNNSGQFTAAQMKGGPSRVPTPLQQSHLASKSPASSPSFQQSSPASSPTVNQAQQQMGPRPPQTNTLPQGFQQPVNSPGRNPMVQQGNVPSNFMVMQQQNQGPQSLHPGLGGMPKRLPPGFTTGQANQNFMQSQVPSTASGTPANGGTSQLQASQNVQHTGGQGNVPPQNQIQVQHGPSNMMQTNLMGLHGNMNNPQTNTNGVPQVNISSIQGQPPQGPQPQLMGMHQQMVSSQGQMVNIQPQGSLNPQNQMILSRAQLMPQGQMMVAPQNQNLGPSQQRMTPPKQMIPQQGQQMMAAHSQIMGPQGQVLLQQNSMMEQMMTNQMQGNKQPFSAQSQSNVMTGPAQIMRGPTPNMQGNMVQFTGQMITQQGPVNGNPSQVMGIQGQVLRPTGPAPHMSQQLSDSATTTNNDVNLTQMLPDVSMQQGNIVAPHLQGMQGNSNTSGSHFAGHGMPFSAPFSGTQNGNQISCGQNPGFSVNKDVTLTSPLLVNLLQSDISAGHFGVNNKQNNQNANKPKKKKPPRKKKNNQQVEQINASESRPAGLEEGEQPPLPGEQGINLDNAGHKLSDFRNRPAGYPTQPTEQRSLQQIPHQLLQHGQQQQQQQQQPPPPPPPSQQPQSQQQQQMMMMLMMQQDSKPVRLPVSQGVHQPRGSLNIDTQRMAMQQGGSMPVMVSLQGPSIVPPSPDKQRIPVSNNPTLNSTRKMVYTDNVQNSTSSPLGEVLSVPSVSEGNGPEALATSGPQNNIASHLIVSQNQLMMTGAKPGPSQMSAPQGTSPQQQSNSLPGSHPHHFQNIATASQTSRPKTPNRASPRPYYPQTPNNRPPSTEPSEISLSPERLNASIAGLFPPQINIPLPPRPNLNRGFDQQGLNPTTLKAIGQAPSNLTMNNQSNFVSPQTHKLDPMTINPGKQTNASGAKRASPSNSRRSSPGSSRKTTPSPGRQNSKATKLALTSQQNPALMQNMDLQRNMMVGPPSLQTSMPGSFQNNAMLTAQNSAIPISVMAGISEDNKESFSVPQDNVCQNTPVGPVSKEQQNIELKGIPSQEIKILIREEQQKKEVPPIESTKLPSLEENNTIVSQAMREAPTSLSQLLDNSGAPNVTIKPSGLPGLEMPPTVTSADEFKKISGIPPAPQDSPSNKDPLCILNLPTNTEACSSQVQQELGDITVSQNTSPVVQRPVSSTSLSTSLPPNQITVYVTSNAITSSSNTSASLPSHLQPTLMPTVVTMPNAGNKVLTSEDQTPVQSNSRPQFITPVFINSSSIIQVMKGSQTSTIPTTPMTANSNLISQPVAVVGPLHLSQNIKFSSGPSPPSSSSNTSVSSMSANRPLVINSLTTPIQLPSSSTTTSSTSSHASSQQSQDFSLEEMNSQTSSSVDLCTETTSQSGTTISPSHAHSPGSSINRRSPVSNTKGKGKVDRIGQFLLTKACKKVTDVFDNREEQYPVEGEVECQEQDVLVPNNIEIEQSLEIDDSIGVPPASTLLKQSTCETGHLNASNTAIPVSTSLNLPGSTPSTTVLSVITTPVMSDATSTIQSTNGNPGTLPAEQVGIAPEDEKAEVHHEFPHNVASVCQTLSSNSESIIQRTDLEANSAIITGLSNELKEICEKSKTPSRRNSKTEEPAVVQETMENGQRKRSSRPASASSTVKETTPGAMQSKRRKSK